MNFPNLFNSRYSLQGRDWVRLLEPEDLRVFVDIGLKAMDHGRLGGRGLVKKHGPAHMRKIGRIGAIASNSRKQWNRAVAEENDRLFSVMLP